MKSNILVCCIIGDQVQKLPFIKFDDLNNANYIEYIESMYYQVGNKINNGYNYFISGGELGIDLDFAETVIDYRNGKLGEKCKIQLEIALPCNNQTKDWKQKDKIRYQRIIALADKVVFINHHTFDCTQKCNEYMINKSDCVLVFCNGENKYDTYNTIQYAKKVGKNIDMTNLSNLCNFSSLDNGKLK